jgi:hypothetical protein
MKGPTFFPRAHSGLIDWYAHICIGDFQRSFTKINFIVW